MVQLVFVHGVATRSGAEYAATVANRELLFRDITFKGCTVEFATPMWGDLVPGVNPAVFHTNAEVPSYSLGVVSQVTAGSNEPTPSASSDVSLTSFALQNPAAALDAIFAELVNEADRNSRVLDAGEVDLFRLAADKFAAEEPQAAFAQIKADADIPDALQKGSNSSFGLLSPIGDAVSAVTDRLRNTVSTVGFNTVRDDVIPAVARFMGDVFVYLKDGALRTRIRAEVGGKLLDAHDRARKNGEPLVLIGHSMGGVILVDMLQNSGTADLPDDLHVAALITVGSQPGLFQSLNVLSEVLAGGHKASRPKSVDVWFNVFDPIDPLAFRAEPVFNDVKDLSFDSITGLASAHTTYFKRPQFYARCRAQLKDRKVI